MSAALRVLLTFIASLAIALGLCLTLYETVAIISGGQTISDLVKTFLRSHLFVALVVVFLVGALLGHFTAWQ